MTVDSREYIEFTVNGKKQKVKNDFSLETTLNEYIRDHLHLKGTKVTCHEGGCGVCIVNGTYFDKTKNKSKNVSINSCLFPLYSCDNWEFTTVEGIGCKSNNQLNPIQKRLADHNGSQCGYCSPGFVMSMYSLLLNDLKPDKETIENTFDGNICRCTGYRSILDAMKSFAATESPIKDIEDLNKMACLNNHQHELTQSTDKSTSFEYNQSKWYSPNSLNDFMNILEINKNENYKILAGNTGKGLFKQESADQIYINTLQLNELYQITQTDDSLIIGANVTLTSLISLFRDKASNASGFEYLNELSKLISKVANTSVRNVATWSGNLVLKHNYSFFPSDLFIAFKTVDAVLTIKSSLNEEIRVNLGDEDNFLKMDLKGKFIYSIEFKKFNKEETFIKLIKIMPRSQSSYHYVTAGFNVPIDEKKGSFTIKSTPRLVFGGVVTPYFESKQAAEYLVGKDLRLNEVFKEACSMLEVELSSLSDKQYHKSLAMSLFYKFALSVNPSINDNAVESLVESRPVSSGIQLFDTKPELYPLTQPMPKSNSYVQTTGEAVYNSDLPALPGQLNAAFITSRNCNCNIQSINYEKALQAPGVRKIVLAKDIPGKNNIFVAFPPYEQYTEELFAEDYVSFAGQPLGLVIAETERQARFAASLVEVTYKDFKKPVITIDDAIEVKSFHPKVIKDFLSGKPDEAVEKSKIKIEGEFSSGGQYHFFLENQFALSTPTEDGYEIDVGSQYLDYVQKAVSQVLNVPKVADIEVKSKQIGGGFGGKASRSAIVACAAAVGSALMNKPVRLALDLNTNIRDGAKRFPQKFKYIAGFDENGKINGIKIQWYSDAGYLPYDNMVDLGYSFFDNAYKVPNLHVETIVVKTNTPINTAMRAPFTFPAITTIEYIMDHIASTLNTDEISIRKLNMYQKGDINLIGLDMPYFTADHLYDSLIETSDYHKRLQNIQDFNKTNRWKKRGISIMPMRYSAFHIAQFYTTMVSVFNGDGSVAVTHGGIEIGQGINTKVAQVCAHELGIPFESVTVKSVQNSVSANSQWTGGSVTTEIVAKGIIECCNIINKNLEQVRQQMAEGYTWKELIAKAFQQNVDISARYFVGPKKEDFERPIKYDVYAAACTEAVIDVLTGESQITRTDILYDCGQSMNAMIDIGQAEGAFTMALGFWFLENIRYNPQNGRSISDGTWEYHPPMSKDIPIDFRVSFLENSPNPVGVLGAKCVGEPPICLSVTAALAVKRAIEAARKDVGNTDKFNLSSPITPEIIQKLCLTNQSTFNL